MVRRWGEGRRHLDGGFHLQVVIQDAEVEVQVSAGVAAGFSGGHGAAGAARCVGVLDDARFVEFGDDGSGDDVPFERVVGHVFGAFLVGVPFFEELFVYEFIALVRPAIWWVFEALGLVDDEGVFVRDAGFGFEEG